MADESIEPSDQFDHPEPVHQTDGIDHAEHQELDESDNEAPHAAGTQIERRRAQKTIFESWLVSDAAWVALKPKTREQKLIDADDDELSIHNLMAKQGAEIINNPRQYQLELFERAKTENCIAVLDTGSGKTLIAVMLLKWIIDQELEDRAKGNQPKISFFLVASVTLVYQQFSVLEKNIDHKVSRVCGADGVDNWNKAKWAKLFAENKVIVATADVLHQCLAHSYITMEQINLLIFDEAHHAKKNHTYARIIKDFYLALLDENRRPKVFGMTASPVDAKTDVEQAANELETLLHCRIATTSDMSLSDAIKKPVEQVLKYLALLQKGFETALLKSIKARFNNPPMFEPVFEKSLEISKQLGRWCADAYLAMALSERRQKRYEMDADRSYHYGPVAPTHAPPLGGVKRSDSATAISQLDKKQELIRSVIDFVVREQPKHAGMNDEDLSSKVRELQKFLGFQFERESSHRCIVFVRTRHTAKLLDAVFKQVGSKHMRCSFLVGSGSPDIDEDSFTNKQQFMTLNNFRKGQINCLFATSVAEEGLDVPDCNLVIRFDMYSTMIQYVQSRGRARQQSSKFIHMIERGNSIHAELLQQVRYQERAMRRFCERLPEDRKLEGNKDDLEGLMAKEKVLRVYTEPSTGAKLTYGNALAYLANFVSAIPTESNENLHPTYIVSNQGSKFIAEVLLPGNAPIRSAIGKICTKRKLARRSAAFEACIELRRKQYMDEHLRPTYQKRIPAMRNALLAINSDKTNQYIMRTKPSIWEQTRGTLPSELYMCIVDFPDGLDHAHRALVLLTRTPIPQFPTFPVYRNDGHASNVCSRSFAKPVKVAEEDLEKITAFTFRIFKDVFSKSYEQKGEQLSYWLAPAMAMDPIIATDQQVPCSDTPPDLDWALLDEVQTNESYKWSSTMAPESLIGRFIVDPWDGARKFYATSLHPELKPLDTVPDDVARHKWMSTILNYSNSLFKQARARREGTWDLEQPVIEATKVIFRRNMLAKAGPEEVNLKTKAILCPEPLRISALPPTIAESCFVWPAIIHRFESYLIALEACELVGVTCSSQMALAALTKDSDNSGDHESGERINFQSGMGDNYERLEFIGDTFLKTATTISVYIQRPKDNEEEFHNRRMGMLCNQNLYDVAVELKLYEYIRSIAFSRRLWYPEGLNLLEGKGLNKDESTAVVKHALGQKTIADVCEALIGAAYLTHDKPGEKWEPSQHEPAVRAVTTLVKSTNHAMMKWSDYSAAYALPEYQTGEASASQIDLAQKVELEHPYHFKYPKLLRSAFTHPSLPQMYEKVPNYQRLEFLGDALLDQASITYLFNRFPAADPQWLTEHKMAMVSNKFLGAVCVNIGFHKHLRYFHAKLQHQITAYATELEEARLAAGEGKDYWMNLSDPPKCLPDIVEAFIGAMFIDSNFDYGVVQRFFEMHVREYFEDMSLYDGFANNHPCTHLHNKLQESFSCQDYRLMAKELPSLDPTEKKDIVAAVIIHDEIVAFSKGKSGRYARLRAAQQAVEMIEVFNLSEFRMRFGCNCVLKEEKAQEVLAADCNV
ncbi:Dicer-like protein 1 [Elasticomyces elasticus]|nr:Dicer-like protein 1 [Elasticomyces elasticus]KAK3664106.1 Dicer-like protein 1 [Elasticomyces elasticus]KAK4927675.1 Dicer-like protein 1 [Elasticomyces elasticus]KAK5767046.1 Dicer-like protein 1 [Elasticomyces elasticus]